MTPPARTARQRKHDALNRLDRDTDAWVARLHPGFTGPSPCLHSPALYWMSQNRCRTRRWTA